MREVALDDCESGARILATGGLAALGAATSARRDAAADAGWAPFWRGFALRFDDLGVARTHWIAAESRFARDGDVQGLDLAACALVEATLLDNQPHDAFAARARRVARMRATGAEPAALALLRRGARLLVAAEWRDAVDRAAGEIEPAFAALGSDVEATIALRFATAALPMLGLALDRLRGDDFVRAGDVLAARAGVRTYTRALWQLVIAETRSHDAAEAPALAARLAAVLRAARGERGRPFAARVHIIRAAIALGAGDVAGGGASLAVAHPLLAPSHPPDYWAFHYYKARHALQSGDADEASLHADLSYRKLVDAGASASRTTPVLMQQGYGLVAQGRLDEGAAAFARAAALSQGAQATPCVVHVHLARALRDRRRGAHDEARGLIVAAFAAARSIDLTHFLRALPALAGEVCGAALELDADAAFARRAIRLRALPCPDPGIGDWPWPLRVRMLGGFAIERDGAAVTFARKAPKRLLDLLRLVVAQGGRRVDAARAAATLWPDADGDVARDALKAMLHRARTLLGADFVLVRDGQIAFDDTRVWLDTWAFEHVCERIDALLAAPAAARGAGAGDGELAIRRHQLFALYRGHAFGEAELPAFALPIRDRLRARFVRAVEALGQRLETTGRGSEAITLYRRALEHDNLAEELYQRLIACHAAAGEHAQALNAYRRCRELLSIVLGVAPSARTEALVARIVGR